MNKAKVNNFFSIFSSNTSLSQSDTLLDTDTDENSTHRLTTLVRESFRLQISILQYVAKYIGVVLREWK